MNPKTPALRARELLAKMTLEEKMYQLSAQMVWDVKDDYEEKRNHKEGNYRNPGHFMHFDRPEPATPAEVVQRINRDVQLTMEAHPHPIPPLEHGEALHGAQWGMATCFPSPSPWPPCSTMTWWIAEAFSALISVETSLINARNANILSA